MFKFVMQSFFSLGLYDNVDNSLCRIICLVNLRITFSAYVR